MRRRSRTQSHFRTDPGDGELVIGMVGPVGTDLERIERVLVRRLGDLRYHSQVLRLSHFLRDIAGLSTPLRESPAYSRYMSYMDAGDEARQALEHGGCLALHAIARISQGREEGRPAPRRAFILRSLKHPDEVHELRHVYGNAFVLLAVHAPRASRRKRLQDSMSPRQADLLIRRDEKGDHELGQGTRETFHLADAFVDATRHDVEQQTARVVDLLFGHPHGHPTFEEHAMFLAQAAAMRSADLSRQVGAVIVSADRLVLASGANEVPAPGGGTYWEGDPHDQRDFKRGFDANAREREGIFAEVLELARSHGLRRESLAAMHEGLRKTRLADLTEYGRAVHAELDAITTCARLGARTQGTSLFTTTFPCHNCAKHIVAAGIREVVYVEPYPKSQALALHEDALVSGETQERGPQDSDPRVRLRPFVGIAPRRFMDLFSMKLGGGRPLERKSADKVKAASWSPARARPRIPLLPTSYLDREKSAAALLGRAVS